MPAYRITSECPLYGAPLTVRRTRQAYALFIGCSGYPACRFTEAYDAAF